jgi:predicted NUDIX family phosphoesterase
MPRMKRGCSGSLPKRSRSGGGFSSRCVGLINDDATPVGSVHLGIVHVLELERPEVQSREAELIECGFEPLARSVADRERFETWSQIALDAVAAGSLG